MKQKEYKPLDNIKCPNCGYQNHKEFVQYSGQCHLCKKVLDEKAYFKQTMNKKLRLWRGEKFKQW